MRPGPEGPGYKPKRATFRLIAGPFNEAGARRPRIHDMNMHKHDLAYPSMRPGPEGPGYEERMADPRYAKAVLQ